MATPENKQETRNILRHVATLKKNGGIKRKSFLFGDDVLRLKNTTVGFCREITWKKTHHNSKSYFTNPQKSICEESIPPIPYIQSLVTSQSHGAFGMIFANH